MRTIRRLYFYAVALVSLEVVVWGVIGLARTVLAVDLVGGRTTPLAQALSLTLVGIPVFVIHWLVAERDARRDPEERASQIRALFLYGALLGTLIPTAQNGLAIFNRLTLFLFGLDPAQAIVGGSQLWTDNLVAIAINLGAAIYLQRVLSADWSSGLASDHFAAVRRLYRYLWLIYGLAFVIFGVEEVLRFLLFIPVGLGGNPGFRLANALALLLVGIPLWVGWGETINRSLADPNERESLLRLVVLYLLALAGVGTVLSTAGIVLSAVLRIILGETISFPDFLGQISTALSVAIPLGGVWAYYGRQLNREVAALSEAPRRAGLRRLYNYILAAFGFIATFLALQQLVRFCVNSLTGNLIWGSIPINQLSTALAALVIGLPLWWLTWQPMQAEARTSEAGGDHARRSIIRKSYLYLALFAMVIGAMISGGTLVYQVLTHLLGSPIPYYVSDTFIWLLTCLLFLLWLVYYIQTLRGDNRLSERSLVSLHAAFLTVLIDPGEGSYTQEIQAAVQRLVPDIPLTVLHVQQGVPGEDLDAPCAIILPSNLALNPPDPLRVWLKSYQGKRIIYPQQDERSTWLGGPSLSIGELARQAATALRQLSESQPLHISPPANAWMMTGYILGGLFGLELLAVLIALVSSSLTGR
jgi:hypothetical protein